MIKHYCDRCGKELENEERSVVEVNSRGGVSFTRTRIELCLDCMGYLLNINAIAQAGDETEEARRKAAERRAEREKARQEAKAANG